MNNKSYKDNSYIDSLMEWQRSQYLPGHFTGGRIPIWAKYPSQPRALGTVIIVIGTLALVVCAIILWNYLSFGAELIKIINVAAYAVFSMAAIAFGNKLRGKSGR